MRIAIFVGFLSGAVVFAQGAGQAGNLFEKGEYERAAQSARKLTGKDPANVEAWLVLADALLKLDQLNEAWDALEVAIEKNPTDPRLDLKLGDIFIGLAEEEQRTTGNGTAIANNYLDAERMYKDALAKDPKLAAALFGMARANFFLSASVAGTKEKARKYLADCLALDKTFGKAHALQGYMLYGEKKYLDAANKYEIALKLDDSSPLDFVRQGHCYYGLGQYDKAKERYIAGLKRHPDNATPITSGLYYLAGKNWRKAGPTLDEATKAAPNSAPAWYYYGYTRFLNEEWEEAAAAFRKAIAIKPDNGTYLYFLGYAFEKQGDGRRALEQYRKSLKANPAGVEAASRFEGLIRMQKDFDRIEKLYEELSRLAPDNGWVHNNYGLILRDWAQQRGAAKSDNLQPPVMRRLKRSGEIYEIAARLLPEEPQIQSDTGLMFEFYPATRDLDKAKTYFTRALELSDYTYRDAFDGLNRACQRSGDWETLLDYAEGVVGSLGRGNAAVAPVGGRPPQDLDPQQTASLLARARAAASLAESKQGGGG